MCGGPCRHGTGVVSQVQITPPTGATFVIEKVQGIAYAIGAAAGHCDPACVGSAWDSFPASAGGRSETVLGPGTKNVSVQEGANQYYADWPHAGKAYGEGVAYASGSSTLIDLRQSTGVLNWYQTCNVDTSQGCDTVCTPAAGVSSGIAKSICQFRTTGSTGTWTGSFSITVNRTAAFDSPRLQTRGALVRITNISTSVVTTTPYQVQTSPSITVASTGLTANDPDNDQVIDSWTATVSISGDHGATFELSIISADGIDLVYDVNADGRFNAGDLAALKEIIGCTESVLIDRWDFSGNNEVDSTDVSVLEDVLATLSGGGVFGDHNGDGGFSCQDGNGAAFAFSHDVSSGSYQPAMDWDQDGVIGTADKAKFNQQYWPMLPDLNYDGIVNTSDQVLLLSKFGQSVTTWTDGDLDGNGVVNIGDLSELLTKYGQSCP